MTIPYWLIAAAMIAAVSGAVIAAWVLRALRPSRELTDVTAAMQRIEQQVQMQAQAVPAELARSRDSLVGEIARLREGMTTLLSQQRQEFGGQLVASQQAVAQQTTAMAEMIARAFEGFGQQLGQLMTQSQQQAESLRHGLEGRLTQAALDARTGREEINAALQQFREAQAVELRRLAEYNGQRLEALRDLLDQRLQALQAGNEAKLEAMRQTVDEKLHATLEARLGESFKLVSERLEQVHRGLGEMATLATGVGDLKKVLTNVKTRGGWGEVQLEALLEQLLTPEQYTRNMSTRPGHDTRVDFAIRLPGRQTEATPVWLPLDAKFPREDYERLIDASERGDLAQIETAGKALEAAVRAQARSIHEKYVEPPHTTDFALMYLPTEGLYAEVLRRPGLADALQRDYRVTLAGPTTLTALLNSLQMGFRTLAIEQRSSEVWKVLGAVKTEFGKFGEVLDKVKKKLDEASSQIEQTGVRSRAIQRQLRNVEALPSAMEQDVTGAPPELLSE